jgi:uncharacterized lipoprotein YmbA
MWGRINKLVTLFYIVVLFNGCVGGGDTTPIRYYLIDPIAYPDTSFKADKSLSIMIVNLHIPQYLERFHIATRNTTNRLEFSENNQWGENLRKNLLRTMARNLSKLLSTIDVGTPTNRSSSLPDYRIQIHIEQFEQDVDKKIKLVARWQLSGGAQSESMGVFNAELQSQQTLEEKNYDHLVSAMRQVYGQLSEHIAESIITQEK